MKIFIIVLMIIIAIDLFITFCIMKISGIQSRIEEKEYKNDTFYNYKE